MNIKNKNTLINQNFKSQIEYFSRSEGKPYLGHLKIFMNGILKNPIKWIILLYATALVGYCMGHPFYWDNIAQLAVPANWYYDTGFQSIFIPDHLATGHPTWLSMLIAGSWKWVGRELWVCHLFMWPAVAGFLYQSWRFLAAVGISERKMQILIMGMIMLDTTIMAQLSLITFEVFHLWLFIWAARLFIEKKTVALAVVLVGLSMVSMRAGLSVAGLGMTFFILQKNDNFLLKRKEWLLIFLPVILVMLLQYGTFYLEKGWVVHNTVSGKWASSSDTANLTGMMRNAGLMVWRLLDFGRVGIYIGMIGILLLRLRRGEWPDNTMSRLWWLIIGQALIFAIVIIPSQNAFGHRYLLPVMVPLTILCTYGVRFLGRWKYPAWIFGAILLLSGHWWIYPEKIAQGWDATTLHWQYVRTMKMVHEDIRNRGIPPSEIGTFFPAYRSTADAWLDKKPIMYSRAEEYDKDYLLYSNAFNVSDEWIDALTPERGKWDLVQAYGSGLIYVKLYRRVGDSNL